MFRGLAAAAPRLRDTPASADPREGAPGPRARRLVARPRSHHGADDPGRELLLADAGELALAPLAGGHREDLLEDLPPDDRERRAFEDHAAVDVHVVFHVAVHEGVRRELDGRHRLAAEDRPAPGGEADDVAPSRDETGDRDRIVAGRVHEHEDGGDAARLVAGGGIVVHGLEAAAVPLPPFVAVDELLGDPLVDRAPDQQVLGAVDLGCLGEDAGAAVADQLVHGPAERRVRGDAGVAVGPAAVRREHELGDRLPRPSGLVGPRQELRDLGGGALDRLPDAARLLDVEDVGGDVRVLGVAGEHALERQVVLAEELRPAARLVRDRDHAVHVRVVALDVAEPSLHKLAHARRAVHAGDDRDVVPRPDAAVLPLEPVEGAHRLAWVVLDGVHVGAELVLALELADAEVVRMDVVARLDVLRGKADDLAVAAQGGARQHPSPRDLVAGLDVLAHLDARAAIFQNRARGELLLRDRDVVFGPQHDGSLGQRECRHGVPPAPNYTGLDPWMRRTTVGSISSWMVVWSMPNRAWRTSCSWRSSRSLSPTSVTITWALMASRPDVSVHTCRSCTRRTPDTRTIAASISARSRCVGVPSSRTLTACLRSPQVRGTMMSAIATDASGSARVQPVATTTSAAATTPTEARASLRTCRYAPRTLRLVAASACRSQAHPRFAASPTTATASIGPPSTSGGARRRR